MKKVIISFILFFLFIFIFSVELYLYNQANRRDIRLEKQICTLSNQVLRLKMQYKLDKNHKLTSTKILGGIGND